MPQYFVAGYLPDDFDRIQSGRSDGPRNPCAQQRDDGCRRQEICLRPWVREVAASADQKAESSSPMGHTLRPRNTSAVFGFWNALTWTRRWHGHAKASMQLGGRSRCERSSSAPHPASKWGGLEQKKVSEWRRR